MAEQFPDPRDTYGRLVRCETKLDDLKSSLEEVKETVCEVKSHIDAARGASNLAQHIGLFVMMVCSALVGAFASSLAGWVHR